jgi:hypothetical protein
MGVVFGRGWVGRVVERVFEQVLVEMFWKGITHLHPLGIKPRLVIPAFVSMFIDFLMTLLIH